MITMQAYRIGPENERRTVCSRDRFASDDRQRLPGCLGWTRYDCAWQRPRGQASVCQVTPVSESLGDRRDVDSGENVHHVDEARSGRQEQPDSRAPVSSGAGEHMQGFIIHCQPVVERPVGFHVAQLNTSPVRQPAEELKLLQCQFPQPGGGQAGRDPPETGPVLIRRVRADGQSGFSGTRQRLLEQCRLASMSTTGQTDGRHRAVQLLVSGGLTRICVQINGAHRVSTA